MSVTSLDLTHINDCTAEGKGMTEYGGQCLPILPDSSQYKYHINSNKIFFEN